MGEALAALCRDIELRDEYRVEGSPTFILFAIGGIYKLGLSPEEIEKCFSLIHENNMKKQMGTKKNRRGFGNLPDAVQTTSDKHEQLTKLLAEIIEENLNEKH